MKPDKNCNISVNEFENSPDDIAQVSDSFIYYHTTGINLVRPQYALIVDGLWKDGKIAATYVAVAKNMLSMVSMPRQGRGRDLFDSYIQKIESVPLDLRMALDEFLLNKLLYAGRISRTARANLEQGLKCLDLQYFSSGIPEEVSFLDGVDVSKFSVEPENDFGLCVLRPEYEVFISEIFNGDAFRKISPEGLKVLINSLSRLIRPKFRFGATSFDEYVRDGESIRSRYILDGCVMDALVDEGVITDWNRSCVISALEGAIFLNGKIKTQDSIRREEQKIAENERRKEMENRAANREADRRKREEETKRKERQNALKDRLREISIYVGVLSVVCFIVFTGWMSLANYMNSQPWPRPESDNDKMVPSSSDAVGRYETRQEFEDALRDAANALYDKCQIYGSSYDERCN